MKKLKKFNKQVQDEFIDNKKTNIKKGKKKPNLKFDHKPKKQSFYKYLDEE
jgi:hypothetical protein